jgi:soluble lytic murein transglycosylase-like protein
MYANNFASSGGYAYQKFYSPYATGQTDHSGNGYARSAGYDNASTMAASQASGAGLPASLVARVIRRESGGNPRAVHAGNYGLMQIRLGTARAMGYTGSAAGLLDPQTNMTYALRYLAGAYRAAGGNESRAVALYSRGYYNQAKAHGFSPYTSMPRRG